MSHTEAASLLPQQKPRPQGQVPPQPLAQPPATGAVAATRHRRHANPFTVRGPVAVPSWDSVFGRRAPLAVDVGCGPGLFVVELARARPDLNVVGLEIRQHLVEATLQAARAAELGNAHALVANANLHLGALFAPNSVAQISFNFPDPWYKKRHHKRRVLNAALLADLLPQLRPGAQVHAMTDYEPLAVQMQQTLQLCSALRCAHPTPFCADSTTGLPSEREKTHLSRGQPIYRLLFVKQD
jgi:tRNA (guanine-N7-)-methyltransferase